MSDYDNKGNVALWKNDSDNERAPILTGIAVAHRDIRAGEEINVSLWKNSSDNDRAPALSGRLQDRYQADQPATTPSTPVDEIPF